MPQPLRISNILAGVAIGTTRSGNADGYRFTFKTVDDSVTFGYIEDNGNSWSAGSAADEFLPAKVVLTLGTDANYALQDFDVITMSVVTPGGNKVMVLWFPANVTDSATVTYYFDVDGNTYSDAALTAAAGGAVLVSDTITLTGAINNYEWALTLTDTLSLLEAFTVDLKVLTLYLQDYINLNDGLSGLSIESWIINLSDVIRMEDTFWARVNLWGQEGAGTSTWVEE